MRLRFVAVPDRIRTKGPQGGFATRGERTHGRCPCRSRACFRWRQMPHPRPSWVSVWRADAWPALRDSRATRGGRHCTIRPVVTKVGRAGPMSRPAAGTFALERACAAAHLPRLTGRPAVQRASGTSPAFQQYRSGSAKAWKLAIRRAAGRCSATARRLSDIAERAGFHCYGIP